MRRLLLNVIDHDHRHRSRLLFELHPKLLFDSLEKRVPADRVRRLRQGAGLAAVAARGTRQARERGELAVGKGEIPAAVQSGRIQNRRAKAGRQVPQALGELRHCRVLAS